MRWKELGREERQETMQGKHDTAGESFGKGSKRKFYFYQPGRGHGRLCSLQHLAGLLSPLLTGGGQTSMIKGLSVLISQSPVKLKSGERCEKMRMSLLSISRTHGEREMVVI